MELTKAYREAARESRGRTAAARVRDGADYMVWRGPGGGSDAAPVSARCRTGAGGRWGNRSANEKQTRQATLVLVKRDKSHYLGELLVWEIEDYLRARSAPPERARVARLRVSSRSAAEAVAAELEAGGGVHAVARRALRLGVASPDDLFGVVTRDEHPEVFEAVPGATLPPKPEGEGFLVIRLVAFEP
ncbi:hypothetical protein Mame01_08170 [Microbispora amethystogenes]|nr:hypothetical protein Mame01_08170 [Microbispora amethystogenes]